MKRTFAKGVSVVEIIIAAALIGISVVGVIVAFNSYLLLSSKTYREMQVRFLIEETGEALQIMRDLGWDANIASLTNGTTYYLSWGGSSYSITATPQVSEGGITRSFVLSPVERDSSDDIVESGTEDDNTRKVDISVSWQDAEGTETRSAEMYLHNTYQE